MYLFLAIFWFAFGLVLRFYWTDHVYRDPLSILCFVLMCYNMVRWRMARALAQAHKDAEESPPAPRRQMSEPDPTFDFSDVEKKPPQP